MKKQSPYVYTNNININTTCMYFECMTVDSERITFAVGAFSPICTYSLIFIKMVIKLQNSQLDLLV